MFHLHGLQSYMGLSGWEAETEPFEDVSKGSVYYEAVMSAGSAGIVQGAGYNRFSPNIYISGIDAQTIISRTLDAVQFTFCKISTFCYSFWIFYFIL